MSIVSNEEGSVNKGSALVTYLIIFAIVIVLGMIGFIYLKTSIHSSSESTNTTSSMTPEIPVKDFAPSLPMSQKTTILIQTSDSSDIKYIVPTDQVDTYVKSLPEGYRVVSKTP